MNIEELKLTDQELSERLPWLISDLTADRSPRERLMELCRVIAEAQLQLAIPIIEAQAEELRVSKHLTATLTDQCRELELQLTQTNLEGRRDNDYATREEGTRTL